eukprot:scaffold74285_cov72-Phaeocystis_antarctica.AAC.9
MAVGALVEQTDLHRREVKRRGHVVRNVSCFLREVLSLLDSVVVLRVGDPGVGWRGSYPFGDRGGGGMRGEQV